MSVNLRLPNITGLSEKEQILQIKNYLYQLVGELQYTFNNSGSPSSNVVASPVQREGATETMDINAQLVFSALKPLIIKSADILNAYYEKMADRFDEVCADFVVEQGTNGGWTYRKWKKGTYDMFGEFSIAPGQATLNETLYVTDFISIRAPFAISSAIVSGTAVGCCWVSDSGVSDTDTVYIRIISDKTISASEITVRLHVIGTYS